MKVVGKSILPSQQEEVQNRPSDQSQNEGNTQIARKKEEASGRSQSEKLEKVKILIFSKCSGKKIRFFFFI